MKRKINFVIHKWNSLLLSMSSLWLAAVYMASGRYIVSFVSLLFVLTKLLGLFSNNTNMRVVGLIGMNITWAVTAYLMFKGYFIHPWQFPAIIALFGFGISLQERFHE